MEGDPQSGILPGINPAPLAPIGSGDAKIQAYNYRLCMTMSPLNRKPIPPQNSYVSQNYELLGRLIASGYSVDFADIFLIRALRGDKFDFNNGAPVSTDFTGRSWSYPEANYFERNDIEIEHKE